MERTQSEQKRIEREREEEMRRKAREAHASGIDVAIVAAPADHSPRDTLRGHCQFHSGLGDG